MSKPALTPARRNGLLVVAEGDRRHQEVRRSNVTSPPADELLTVYWQTANWLAVEGLAVDGLGPQRDGLRLTPAGRVLAGKITARERAAR